MKKTLLIVALVVLALGALGVGVVAAQGQNPPTPGFGYDMMGGYGGYGWMHDYVEQALAAKLGLTESQVEDALANGKTIYQIALDNGIAEADLPTFMTDVHQMAFDKAVADGVLTQEQADWMLQHMQGMYGNGYGFGNCPMGGVRPQDGTGFRGGFGSGQGNATGPGNASGQGNVPAQGMMGRGRWQQAPAQ
jgi:Spy/CpxP family protein refolding chaperone